jgi:hypothetical protein
MGLSRPWFDWTAEDIVTFEATRIKPASRGEEAEAVVLLNGLSEVQRRKPHFHTVVAPELLPLAGAVGSDLLSDPSGLLRQDHALIAVGLRWFIAGHGRKNLPEAPSAFG